MTQTGSPDPRNDRICITSSCPRQLVCSVTGVASRLSQAASMQLRLLVSLAAGHDGPGDPCHLVGQGDSSHFRRPALHQPPQPRPLLRAVLLRVADHGHGAGDEKPSQVSIALLGDTTELVLATRCVLLRYQPNPGSQTTPRLERLPVADLGNKSGGDNRPDARNLFQPPARLAGAMPGQNTLTD